MNVATFQEVQTVDQSSCVSKVTSDSLCNTSSRDDFDSITPFNSSILCKTCSDISLTDISRTKSELSLDTISSVQTINRPVVQNCSPPNTHVEVNAFVKLDNSPFHLFNKSHLESSTTGYMNIGSRQAAYYGKFPYSYGGIKHSAKKLRTMNTL